MASDTRNRTYRAAIDLFSQKGYKGTSLKDIAALVGVQHASLYAHFKAKDYILTAIYDEFEESYTRRRPTPEGILSIAETQSLEAALSNIFFKFEAGEETERMMKITKIVFSLQYEDRRAAELVNGIMVDGALAVRQEIFETLKAAGKIREIDTRWLAYVFLGFSYAVLQKVLLHGMVVDGVVDDFAQGVRYMAAYYAALLTPPAPQWDGLSACHGSASTPGALSRSFSP